MILIAMVFSGMFAIKNPEYVAAVKQNKEDGLEWQYVGPQSPNEQEEYISGFLAGKEIILFKMGEPKK